MKKMVMVKFFLFFFTATCGFTEHDCSSCSYGQLETTPKIIKSDNPLFDYDDENNFDGDCVFLQFVDLMEMPAGSPSPSVIWLRNGVLIDSDYTRWIKWS